MEDGGGSTTLFIDAAKELAMQSPESIEAKVKAILAEDESEDARMSKDLLKRHQTASTLKLQTELLMTKL